MSLFPHSFEIITLCTLNLEKSVHLSTPHSAVDVITQQIGFLFAMPRRVYYYCVVINTFQGKMRLRGEMNYIYIVIDY